MRKFLYILIACLLLLLVTCRHKHYDLAAPVNTPNTTQEMKTAGFWITKIKEPDKVILDEEGIKAFNLKVEKELKLTTDPLTWPAQYNGKELKATLTKDLQDLSKRKLYTANGKAAGEDFYQPIQKNFNLEGINEKGDARYAFLVYSDDQRVLPTDLALTQEPRDLEFDEVQNSSLDIGTPLLVLHESADGNWVYAQTFSSNGWFKKENVAFCDLSEFKAMLPKDNFLVVTSGKADIFLDQGLKEHYGYVRMGAKFNFEETADPKVFVIIIPAKAQGGRLIAQKGYIKRQDVNIGYLPYTQRNIIEQAFKLLNSPYGWGGKNGEQDCSSYIQEIFMTVGLNLPRSSSAQGTVGMAFKGFKQGLGTVEKQKLIAQEAVAGVTILQMNGHVALFLGMHTNNAYIIHETHGYGQRITNGDITWVVNRVIVSDLDLGKGSKKGTLLSRIVNIRLIK